MNWEEQKICWQTVRDRHKIKPIASIIQGGSTGTKTGGIIVASDRFQFIYKYSPSISVPAAVVTVTVERADHTMVSQIWTAMKRLRPDPKPYF